MNRGFATRFVTVDNGPERYGATHVARGSSPKPCPRIAFPTTLWFTEFLVPPRSSNGSMPLVPAAWQPWMEDNLRPIGIPVTTRTRYISFQAALNLRLPGEHTGDWHEIGALFTNARYPAVADMAGRNCKVNTTRSLGNRGVRDMAHILESRDLIEPGHGPVWVANHYRAIADFAMLDRIKCLAPPQPTMIEVRIVNKYLDTEAQVEHLLEHYLKPLRNQLNRREQKAFDKWLPTIVYD